MTRINPLQASFFDFSLFSLITDPLDGVSLWKAGFAVASAFSTTGVVFSLVKGISWATWGFGSISVISLTGLYFSDDLDEMEQLKKTADKLKKTKDRLEVIDHEWSSSVTRYETQNRRLGDNVAGLNRAGSQLAAENKRLKAQIQMQTQANADTERENGALKQEIADLQGQLERFHAGITNLQTQLDRAAAVAGQEDRVVADLSHDTQRLENDETQLAREEASLEEIMERDLAQLGASIGSFRDSTTQEMEDLRARNMELDASLNALQQRIEELRKDESLLAAEEQRAKALEDSAAAKGHELSSALSSLSATEKSIEEETRRLREIQSQREQEQRAYDALLAQLKVIREQYEKLLATVSQVDAALNEKLERLEKVKAELRQLRQQPSGNTAVASGTASTVVVATSVSM